MTDYENEIASLKQQIQALSSDEQQIVNVLSQLIKQYEIGQLQYKTAVSIARNMKYEILDPRVNRDNLFYPTVMSSEETLDKLLKEKCSIARFGDGEFAIMANHNRQKFHEYDAELARRLIEVLHSKTPDLMIAIADNYGDLSLFNQDSADAIRAYLTEDVRKEHYNLLEQNRVYYNAYVTRPYVLFADNATSAPKIRFEKWKQVWNNRDIIIVEGAESRLGVGNDLFDNCHSIRRILAPATNSYSKYDYLLNASLKYADENDLFLIALGPSAGILAYDLTTSGYQAIDIGHLDLEYEWFLAGQGTRVPIATKYNNECPDDNEVQQIHDKNYINQILESF